MKKCVILSCKLWKMILVLLVIVGVILGYVLGVFVTKNVSAKPHIFTIVIDAGHGGRDAGCSGINTGVKESDINLSIAKKLQEKLEAYGFYVVMTRDGDYGLYDSDADNFKLSDMYKRVGLIKRVSADMVISIHQNSFRDDSLHGAQVFYQEGDDASMILAYAVQQELKNVLGDVRGEHNFSDLYLLKESNALGVLIECGYLTNTFDEEKLQDYKYQEKVAYAILSGIIRYLVTIGVERY